MPEVLAADNLQGLPGIRHGFFTSAWGNCGLSDAYDRDQSAENRRRVAESLSIAPENLLSCYQIHSPNVVTIDKPWEADQRPKADAMVTKERGIALGVLTADCVPLLLVDTKAGVIGAAHAGWRGALSGIIENTLGAMEKLGAAKKSVIAALGPCIAQNSYEVGPEFPAPFLAENPANEKFFRPAFRGDHYMFNLPGYVEARLRALGVTSVEPPSADTCVHEGRFFSYRRSYLQGKQRAGSLISAIVLAD